MRKRCAPLPLHFPWPLLACLLLWLGAAMPLQARFDSRFNTGFNTSLDAGISRMPDTRSASLAESIGQQGQSGRYWFGKGLEAYEAGEYVLAERIWQVQAAAGDTDSGYHLGVLYDQVHRQPVRAVQWYARAARQGHRDAQHNLAVALARGEGIEMNIRQALAWWRRAARQGSKDAAYNLGVVYARGAGQIGRDMQKAERWWLQAARLGDPMAQYNLGALYVAGQRVQDACKARHWFRRSQANGFRRAAAVLDRLETLLQDAHCP